MPRGAAAQPSTLTSMIPEVAARTLNRKWHETKGDKVSKFKCIFTMETGQKVNARWDGNAFYYRHATGEKVQLFPPSFLHLPLVTDAVAAGDPDAMRWATEASGLWEDYGGSDTAALRRWRGEVEQNATGNHEPRNHPVRVPTRAGEPVRG